MATITEDYVSFETAKLLKEKGFNENCYCHYSSDGRNQYWNYQTPSDGIACPTLQMAMKWLREVHHLTIITSPQWAEGDMRNTCTWRWEIRGLEDIILDAYDNRLFGFTYEDTVEIALRYVLNHLI